MMPGARGQSGPGLPGMPTSLPILSSAELDQIMELHRRIHSEVRLLRHPLLCHANAFFGTCIPLKHTAKSAAPMAWQLIICLLLPPVRACAQSTRCQS